MPTSDSELLIYVNDRRYTLRADGFVSLRGGARGGELLTKPFHLDSGDLRLNYSTSAIGSLRAELRSADSGALLGYRLRDCAPLVGDHSSVCCAGREIGARRRFIIQDGDLYSLRFA